MNNKLKADDKKYIGNTFKRYDAVFAKGKGAEITDTAGKKYIDLLAGVAVNLLGYNNPAVNAAMTAQIKKYTHTSNWFYSENQIKLAELLVKNSFGSKVFYVNSGAEATEVAIKIVRKWGMLHKNGAYKVITMRNSFHGRTIAALTATAQEKFHKYLKPLPEGFMYADFNDISSVEKLIDDKTAAVLVEPIQAEGGVLFPDKNYFKELKALCEKKNVLLIADEVQTGLGRTGKLFAYQNFGFEPDMMTLGKGLGGGLPLSAVIISEKLEDVYTVGDHGTTMGGNPVACAAGYAVLKQVNTKSMLKMALTKGNKLMKDLKKLNNPVIKDIRGMGLIIGVELTGDNANEAAARAFKQGVIINACKPNVLRLVPPLIITQKQADKAVKVINRSLA